MSSTITLCEVTQGFVRYVRAVEAGCEYVITRNGAPVARQAALARTRARMAQGWALDAGPLDREGLRER